MSDAFFQLQKAITEVGQLQARLIAENKRLRAENERLTADGIHTCHEQCQRHACVLRRERDAALADVERLKHERKRLEREYPWKE